MLFRFAVGVKAQCLFWPMFNTGKLTSIRGTMNQYHFRWLVFEAIWETGKKQWPFFVWNARR